MTAPRIRTRIAPSPTGFAHVGTAYAALFNFAFAKKNGGDFILRIEDTDVKRNVEQAEKAIYQGLAWLGLSWAEGPDKGGKYGPYRQSERLAIYKKESEKLLEKGYAYEEAGAIRFKNPGKDISWIDEVRGEISFSGGEITDFVLLKSDGFPTYNFGVVIDDIEMEITHVIRGEEHISNTPRQLALYKAFGVSPPQFAHLPTLRNKERKKLSKRQDPVDLRIFRKQGYLPEALVNFLCLLGWSHPEEKEIFGLEEFVSHFDLKKVRKAGPVFDMTKLDWMNGEYLRKASNSKLKNQIYEFFSGKYPEEKLETILPLVKDRIKTLSEFEDLAGFFFKEKKPKSGFFEKDYKKHLREAVSNLEKVKDWNKGEIDKVLLATVDKNSFKTGQFFMNLRVAITGSRATPPINESIVVLGREETINRLKSILN